MNHETFNTVIAVIAAVGAFASPWVSIWESDRRRKGAERDHNDETLKAEYKGRRDLDDCMNSITEIKKVYVTINDLASLKACIDSMEKRMMDGQRRSDHHLRQIYKKLDSLNLGVLTERTSSSIDDIKDLQDRLLRVERRVDQQSSIGRRAKHENDVDDGSIH